MIFAEIQDEGVECPTCLHIHEKGDGVFISCHKGHSVAYCNSECAEGHTIYLWCGDCRSFQQVIKRPDKEKRNHMNWRCQRCKTLLAVEVK